MDSRRFLIRIIISCLIVAAFIITVGFASHKQAVMPCTGLFIKIHDSSGLGFVEVEDIRQMIQNKIGSPIGKSLASINISLLEKIINTNPFIYDAEVFSTVDGKVNIDVKQRIPVLRVINYSNESFYIDNDGVFMPPSDKFTARVPVASGFIFDKESDKRIQEINNKETKDTILKRSKLEQLFHIISYTNQNTFWNDMVQQLYVNVDGDIEMIPRIGNHSVVLGDDLYLDEKFKKLFVFYSEGLSKKGWDKYSMINLKYKDQVVCTKK